MNPVEPVVSCSSFAGSDRPVRADANGCALSVCTARGDVSWFLDDFFPAQVGWQCYRGLGGTWGTRETRSRRNKQEFVLGRQAAYAALCAVGLVANSSRDRSNELVHIAEADAPTQLTEAFLTSVVGKNADRSPRWPNRFVGSISHSRHWIIAAAAQSYDLTSIGIDSEPIAHREQAELLKQDIGHAAEWQLLDAIGLSLPATFTLLFSAKEAYYKCWYPLKNRFLDFRDVIARRVEPKHKWLNEGRHVGEITLELDETDAMQMSVRYCITAQDVFTIATLINCDVE